ncbi:DNA-binding chaperone, putative [Plasmodium ovale]|nr:DNA-binding chaperone, putative [Plasmodium ovale]
MNDKAMHNGCEKNDEFFCITDIRAKCPAEYSEKAAALPFLSGDRSVSIRRKKVEPAGFMFYVKYEINLFKEKSKKKSRYSSYAPIDELFLYKDKIEYLNELKKGEYGYSQGDEGENAHGGNDVGRHTKGERGKKNENYYRDEEEEDNENNNSKNKQEKANSKKSSNLVKKCINNNINVYEVLCVEESDDLETIKSAYKKLILIFHPDKNKGTSYLNEKEKERKKKKEKNKQKEKDKGDDVGAKKDLMYYMEKHNINKLTPEEKKLMFLKIQDSYAVLSDKILRRQYDSSIPFDEYIPTLTELEEAPNFYEFLRPIFKRNAKWSVKKPVPDIGDENTNIKNVKYFYDFWYNFINWRDFSYQNEYDYEEAECREERRWMERENKKIQKKASKAENLRIIKLVDLAYNNDPRIIAENKRLKLEKQKRKELAMLEKQKKNETLLTNEIQKDNTSIQIDTTNDKKSRDNKASVKIWKHHIKCVCITKLSNYVNYDLIQEKLTRMPFGSLCEFIYEIYVFLNFNFQKGESEKAEKIPNATIRTLRHLSQDDTREKFVIYNERVGESPTNCAPNGVLRSKAITKGVIYDEKNDLNRDDDRNDNEDNSGGVHLENSEQETAVNHLDRKEDLVASNGDYIAQLRKSSNQDNEKIYIGSSHSCRNSIEEDANVKDTLVGGHRKDDENTPIQISNESHNYDNEVQTKLINSSEHNGEDKRKKEEGQNYDFVHSGNISSNMADEKEQKPSHVENSNAKVLDEDSNKTLKKKKFVPKKNNFSNNSNEGSKSTGFIGHLKSIELGEKDIELLILIFKKYINDVSFSIEMKEKVHSGESPNLRSISTASGTHSEGKSAIRNVLKCAHGENDSAKGTVVHGGEKNGDFDAEMNGVVGASPSDVNVSPSGDVNASPSGGVNVSPSGGVNVSPSGGVNVSPSNGVNASPSGNVNVSPSGGVNVSPSDGVNASPSGGVNASPSGDVNAATSGGETPARNCEIDAPGKWTAQEVSLLAKALKSYPGGTRNRWEHIANTIKTKSVKEVIKKTKEMFENETLKNLSKNFEETPFDNFKNQNKGVMKKIDDSLDKRQFKNGKEEMENKNSNINGNNKVEEKRPWTHEEQHLLEKALMKYPASIPIKERLKLVSTELKTRTIDEIILRMKTLRAQILAKKSAK